MDTYHIDGTYLSEDDSLISVKDLAVLRGFGVFDFLITYNKRPFHLGRHIERLENSARKIGLRLNHTHDQIRDVVHQTLMRNGHHVESNIRIVYTGGVSPDGVTPAGNGKLMVMVTPRSKPPDWWYEKGAKVVTVDMERTLPGAKSTSYLSAVYAQARAAENGAIEAIYVDGKGRILEGTTTNFFMVKDNSLITPDKDILPGITRGVVLDLMKGRLPIVKRDILFDETEKADEIIITASNKEVVPIVTLNQRQVGGGKPGPVAVSMMEAFNAYTEKYGKGLDVT